MAKPSAAEEQISKLLAQIYELEQGIAHSTGDAAAAQLLHTRMAELSEGLAALGGAAAALGDVRIPQPALRHVDAGGHPDDYVRGLAEAALRDNQLAKGRVHAIAALRAKIAAEAEAALPEAMAAYREVAAAAAAAADGRGGGGGKAEAAAG